MRSLLLSFALLLAPACAPKTGSTEPVVTRSMPEADEVIARAIARSGGEDAIRSHSSVRLEGEMRMAAQGIVATMRMVQQAPGELYSVVDLPGVGLMEEGVSNGVAWARDPLSGPRIKEGVERAQALRSADPYYLLNLHQHFERIETRGRMDLEGRKVWVLSMVPKEGKEELGYFDVGTGDWVGSRMLAETAMGNIQITTLNDDYREIDGMWIAHRMRVVNALMSTEIVWQSVTFDPPDLVVPPMPDEVRALIAPSEAPASGASGG